MTVTDFLSPDCIRSYMTLEEYLRYKPEPTWSDFERRWIKPRVRVPMARKVELCRS